MPKNGNMPVIRFAGFTESWEQRELGILASITMGQSPDGKTYSNTPSKYILVQGNADLENGWVSPRVWTTEKTKECRIGDIIMSVRAPAGAVGKTAYNAVIGRGVAAIRGNEFIYQSLIKMDSNGFWKSLSTGSTFESLNSDNISKALIYAPLKEEQTQIGKIFQSLDNLITLHQRKYEKLLNIKNSLLEKMFPSEGETTPEIRFTGYSKVWEQRKFDEVVIRIATGLNPRDNFTLNSGGKNYYVTIKNFEHGHLCLDENCDKIDDEALTKIQTRSDLQVGDVLFTSIGRVGDCFLIEKPAINWNINESVFVFRPNIKAVLPEYLFHVIHSDKVLEQILNDVTGSTFKSIKIGNLKKTIVPVTSVDEQKKISTFITNLDRLITLHQLKCEKLESIKKSLLEKMFV